MLNIRLINLNRYLVCYFKKENDKIIKKVKIVSCHTKDEATMIIAKEIGSSEIIEDNEYSKMNKIGIKYVRFKENNLKIDGKEEIFKHKMGYFNRR